MTLILPKGGRSYVSAAGATPTYLNVYQQTVTLDGGTPSETTSSVFPSPGDYVVVLAHGTVNDHDLTLSGSSVTSATKIVKANDSKASGSSAEIWIATTDAASDLTWTNLSSDRSLIRAFWVYSFSGVTASGAISQTATGNQGAIPATATTGSSVPDGYAVFAAVATRSSNATGVTWGSDASGGLRTTEVIGSDTLSAADFIKSGAGTTTVTATPVGDDGGFNWALAVAALTTA